MEAGSSVARSKPAQYHLLGSHWAQCRHPALGYPGSSRASLNCPANIQCRPSCVQDRNSDRMDRRNHRTACQRCRSSYFRMHEMVDFRGPDRTPPREPGRSTCRIHRGKQFFDRTCPDSTRIQDAGRSCSSGWNIQSCPQIRWHLRRPKVLTPKGPDC